MTLKLCSVPPVASISLKMRWALPAMACLGPSDLTPSPALLTALSPLATLTWLLLEHARPSAGTVSSSC